MSMRGTLLVLASVLAAGCMTPGTTVDPESGPDLDVLSFIACAQTHTFAPYPVEAFAGMLPEGWALQPADSMGRTTQFYYAASACEGAAEAWGYLFVTPPDGNDENASGDLWPLGGLVSGDGLLATYERWGLAGTVLDGDVTVQLSAPAPGSVVSATRAAGPEETFEVDAAGRGVEAPFHGGVFRVWIPSEEDATGVAGSFLYSWPEGGVELGLGGGTLRYDGPLLNAPPAGPAVVHMVRDVTVDVTRTA